MDSFNPDFRTENIVSAKKARIEWKRNKFESFVLFSTIRWKDEVNFLKVFTFLVSLFFE